MIVNVNARKAHCTRRARRLSGKISCVLREPDYCALSITSRPENTSGSTTTTTAARGAGLKWNLWHPTSVTRRSRPDSGHLGNGHPRSIPRGESRLQSTVAVCLLHMCCTGVRKFVRPPPPGLHPVGASVRDIKTSVNHIVVLKFFSRVPTAGFLYCGDRRTEPKKTCFRSGFPVKLRDLWRS